MRRIATPKVCMLDKWGWIKDTKHFTQDSKVTVGKRIDVQCKEQDRCNHTLSIKLPRVEHASTAMKFTKTCNPKKPIFSYNLDQLKAIGA